MTLLLLTRPGGRPARAGAATHVPPLLTKKKRKKLLVRQVQEIIEEVREIIPQVEPPEVTAQRAAALKALEEFQQQDAAYNSEIENLRRAVGALRLEAQHAALRAEILAELARMQQAQDEEDELLILLLAA